MRLIDMPAPPRKPAPRKRTAASGSLAKPASLLDQSLAVPASNQVVQMPVSGQIPLIERLAQFWLFGIAFIGLWGGLFYIAFTQGETNERYLMLGFGGLATASLMIWAVEYQRRRHGELAVMHDYLLGMGLFFAAAGLFWTIRWAMAFAADPEGLLNWSWLVEESRPFTDEGWVPASSAIYIQGAAAVLLGFASWWYLEVKETGTGVLSWFVASLTPLALLVVGLGTWMEWSNEAVSYELGIAIVVLSILGMWIGLQSNRSLVFSVVAVIASFMPILYELFNDGSGSALSLMVFIIFAQGLLAISPQLKDAQAVIERASLGLVIAVLIAMAWMTGGNLTLHLGPVKFEAGGTLSGAAILWFSLLIGYFGAVNMKRVPWMPVGLAFALFLIPSPSNQFTWAVTLLMLPYLLWKPDSRHWVRQATFCCAAFAFLIVDWMSHAERTSGVQFWGSIEGNLIHIIPLALLSIGEWARRLGRISGNSFRIAMMLVVVSPSMLIEANSLIPWAFSLYLIIVAAEVSRKEVEGLKQRMEASLTIITSMALTTMLAAFGRLEITWKGMPELDGFNLVLALIAIAYFALGKFSKVDELDFGHLHAWTLQSGGRLPVFDPKTGVVTVPKPKVQDPENPDWLTKSWGPLAKASLIGPLILFGISLASVDSAALLDKSWVLLLALPVAVLIWAVLNTKESTAVSRAVAVSILWFLALPLSIKFHENGDFNGSLEMSRFLFDAILLAGPLAVHLILQKRGLTEAEMSRNADSVALIGLLLIGTLDTSGGLVFFTMFAIVAHNIWQHSLTGVAYFAPFTLLYMGTHPGMPGGILNQILGTGALSDLLLSDGHMLDFRVSRILGWFGAALALMMIVRIIQDRRNPPEHDARLSFIWSALVLMASMQAVLIEDAYLLLIMVTIIVVLGWAAGRSEVFIFAPWAYLIALPSAIDASVDGLGAGEIMGYSTLLAGIVTMLFSLMARNGSMFKFSFPVVDTRDGPRNLLFYSTNQDRELIQKYMYGTGLILLFLSFDIYYGISTVLAATWVTYDSYKNGERNLFLFSPLLHVIALVNVERMTDTISVFGQDVTGYGGWILVMWGIAFSTLAWKQWYPEWGWSEDGSDYWEWNDRMGMLGVIYFCIGIWWAGFDFSTLLVALIIILFGGAMVAIDPESAWRRAMGVASSTLGGVVALVGDHDQTLGGIVLIIAGLAAFIQAVMYFQRWGVGMGQISVEEGQVVAEEMDIPPPVKSEKSEESESSISAPKTPSIAESKTEDVEEDEEDSQSPRLIPDVEEVPETEGVLDMSEMSPECSAAVIDLMNGLVDSGQGYKIQLNESMANKIRSALLTTDFSGFIPRVNFDNMGRAILSFEADASA